MEEDQRKLNPRGAMLALLRSAVALILCSQPGRAADQKAKASPQPQTGVVATLGDQPITNTQLEELAKDRLMRLRTEEYQIKRQVLEEYITRTLLEWEAKARSVSVEQLQKAEVDEKGVNGSAIPFPSVS